MSQFSNRSESTEEIDIKEIILYLLSFWRLFVISVIAAVFIVFLVNRYSTNIYKLSTLVNIKESENPLASSNVSLMFKWGGTSELVQAQIATLKSRNHNHKVIEKLNFEVEYFSTGRIKIFTRYSETPYKVIFDKNHLQVLNVPFNILINRRENTYSLLFEKKQTYRIIDFTDGTTKEITSLKFNNEISFGEWVESDAYRFKIELNPIQKDIEEDINFYFRFRDPKQLVDGYIKSISITEESDGASLLRLAMVGDNKNKISAYLNTSIELLKEFELAQKNLLAENTIKFVDLQMEGVVDTLRSVELELEQFRVNNQIMDLGSESAEIYSKYVGLESQNAEIALTIKYYTYLKQYLQQGDDFSSLMAPSVVGIDDPILVQFVNNLVGLSIKRNRMLFSIEANNPVLIQLNSEILLTRNSLRENVDNLIRATEIKQKDLKTRLNSLGEKLATLPGTEQSLINIKRKYELSSRQYDFLVEKRAEAELSKAGNLPDVQVIDKAMDYDDLPIKPKRVFNYIIGLLMGLSIPVLFVIIKLFVNSKITSKKELEKVTNIPVIGSVGHSSGSSNVVIQNGLKSSVAESFRIIRTNLKFLFTNQDPGSKNESKVVLVTSSIGGEGKTFCAINLASIIAIGRSKTIIIGLDMRKPKIFNDFKLTNDVGLSDYLVGEVSLTEVIKPTEVNDLDFITAGPVPPNPSELLLSPKMNELFVELRNTYDYIILDTPPIVLVSDALELMKYADATLYIARQNYTQSGLLETINTQFEDRGLKNISIIFNDVIMTGYGYGYNYGYNYGYGYGYGYGYYDDDKVKVPWWKKII